MIPHMGFQVVFLPPMVVQSTAHQRSPELSSCTLSHLPLQLAKKVSEKTVFPLVSNMNHALCRENLCAGEGLDLLPRTQGRAKYLQAVVLAFPILHLAWAQRQRRHSRPGKRNEVCEALHTHSSTLAAPWDLPLESGRISTVARGAGAELNWGWFLKQKQGGQSGPATRRADEAEPLLVKHSRRS